MKKLTERLSLVSEGAVRQRLQALATQAQQSAPGASVAVTEGDVVIEGRSLVNRWLREPALRFLAGICP